MFRSYYIPSAGASQGGRGFSKEPKPDVKINVKKDSPKPKQSIVNRLLERALTPYGTSFLLNQSDEIPFLECPKKHGITHTISFPILDGFELWHKQYSISGEEPRRLFSFLHKYLISSNLPVSDLVLHFVSCENQDEPYTDPDHPDIVLFSYRVSEPNPKNSEYDEDESEELFIKYIYYVRGGVSEARRINTLDSDLFDNLCQMVRSQSKSKRLFFGLNSMDVAMDHSDNLMPFFSDAVNKGHLNTNGLHPFGYGHYRNNPGVAFGKPVGRQSRFYKERKDKGFVDLDTLYIGNKNHNGFSFCIYNKSKEQLDRYGSLSKTQTRIELRINFNKLTDSDMEDWLSDSSVINPFNKKVSLFRRMYARVLHFLVLIFDSFQVSRKQRERFDAGDPKEQNVLTNWFYESVVFPLQNFIQWLADAVNNEHIKKHLGFPGPFHSYDPTFKLGILKSLPGMAKYHPLAFCKSEDFYNLDSSHWFLRNFKSPQQLRPLMPVKDAHTNNQMHTFPALNIEWLNFVFL